MIDDWKMFVCQYSENLGVTVLHSHLNPCTLFRVPSRPRTQFFAFLYIDTCAFRSDPFCNRYSSNNTQQSYKVSPIPLTEA